MPERWKPDVHITADGLERTVSVNYLGPYLLTRKLLPVMTRGARIVNMVSCTYAIGRLDFSGFLLAGKKGRFLAYPCLQQYKVGFAGFLPVELSERLKAGRESPSMLPIPVLFLPISSVWIMWFDPLTDHTCSVLVSVLRSKELRQLSVCFWMSDGKKLQDRCLLLASLKK